MKKKILSQLFQKYDRFNIMKLIFVVLIGLTLTFCCENGCSGHGECGNGDKCDCFPGWGGNNCNLSIFKLINIFM